MKKEPEELLKNLDISDYEYQINLNKVWKNLNMQSNSFPVVICNENKLVPIELFKRNS